MLSGYLIRNVNVDMKRSLMRAPAELVAIKNDQIPN